MNTNETIQEFLSNHGHEYQKKGQFNIYRREDFVCNHTTHIPNRRDFYKISLITEGTGILNYADRSIHIDKPAILFLNPQIPYAWEPVSEIQQGLFCLFTEEFIHQNLKNESLSQSSLFKVGGDHTYFPSENSMQHLRQVFENMIHEIDTAYVNKYDLLRSYVQIIMHEAMKIQAPQAYYQPKTASERISALFLELLERQFPIDSPNHLLKLKTANEYAFQLNIHTNTLNKALKENTGKTTTEWISEAITKEAKALLRFSSWNIAEIAYSLGFEHASNFIIFFKKQTNITPLQFRKTIEVT